MYEIKRIFLDKKLISVFLIILVCNCFVFYKENISQYNDTEYYEDNYLKNYGSAYDKLIEEYKQMDVKEAEGKASEKLNKLMDKLGSGENVDGITLEAYSNVCQQLTYIVSYSDKYDMVLKNADSIYKNSELSKEGTFSRRNVDKTVEDFKMAENVTPSLDYERSVSAFINYSFSDYLILIFMIVMVLVIYRERKRDLWSYVYTLKNGRRNVAAIRSIAILSGSVIGVLALALENIILCRIYYGSFGDMTRAAQSNEIFNNLTLEINMLQCFVIIFFMKVIVASVIGGVFWLLISNIRIPVISFGIFGVFIVLEYFAYTEITSVSNMKNLKYINVFSMMDGKNMLGTYNNLNIFGQALGKIVFLSIFFIILYVLINAVIIVSGERKPFSQRTGRISEKLNIFGKGIFEYTAVICHEMWKLIMGQKVWIVLALFILLCIGNTRSEKVYFDYRNTIYNQYMEVLSGDVTPEKIEYLDEEKGLWDKKKQEAEAELKQYESGEKEYNVNAVDSLKKKIEKLNEAKTVVEELYNDSMELYSLKEDGYSTGYVNNVSYGMFMGYESRKANDLDAVLLIAFTVMAVSSIWSVENQNNMSQLIRTTAGGRGKLLAAKIGISFCMASIGETVLFVMRFIQRDNTYGLDNLDMSARSLNIFRDLETSLSIGGIIIVFYLLRLLSLFMIILMIQYISYKAKNNVYSMAANGVLFVFPAYLYYVGIDTMKYASPVKCVSVISLWLDNINESFTFLQAFAVVIIAGAGILILHIRRNFRCA